MKFSSTLVLLVAVLFMALVVVSEVLLYASIFRMRDLIHKYTGIKQQRDREAEAAMIVVTDTAKVAAQEILSASHASAKQLRTTAEDVAMMLQNKAEDTAKLLRVTELLRATAMKTFGLEDPQDDNPTG
jgi:flagellar biosynthesis/type III secretory pathway M-ring protein FliF/YscJ